jgi:hypothetical protein
MAEETASADDRGLAEPAEAARPRRMPGLLKGRITLAENFDVWPDELLESFEGVAVEPKRQE